MEVSGSLPTPFPLLHGKNLGNYLTEDQVVSRGSPDVLEKGKLSSLTKIRALDHSTHSTFPIRNVKSNGFLYGQNVSGAINASALQ